MSFLKKCFKFFHKIKKYLLWVLFIWTLTFIVGLSWNISNGLNLDGKMSLDDWERFLNIVFQFLLVCLGSLALYQIVITKNDFRIKYSRESIDKSVQLAEKFAVKIIPKINQFRANVKSSKRKFQSLDLKYYYKDEIIKGGLVIESAYIDDINFLKDNSKLLNECVEILNLLELFSLSFTHRIADESAVFKSLSEVYCMFIRDNSSLMCFLRDRRANNFTNVVDLYRLWSDRIKKEGLLIQSVALSEKFNAFQEDNKLKPLGIG